MCDCAYSLCVAACFLGLGTCGLWIWYCVCLCFTLFVVYVVWVLDLVVVSLLSWCCCL